MANIGYIRVSTKEQNTGRQFQCFTDNGIKMDKIFEEHVSEKIQTVCSCRRCWSTSERGIRFI